MTTVDLPVLVPGAFDFSIATPVISAAQKFVVPVPCFPGGGEPLVIPADQPDAGQRIADWRGKPVGDYGVIFWNPTDKSWQAARGDGTAVVIMNEVRGSEVGALYDRYSSYGKPDRLSLASFKAFLAFATGEIGVKDLYHSDRSFVVEHMTPVTRGSYTFESEGNTFGFLKRDARDISAAVFVDEPFCFDMPGDRPMQRMEHGGVIVALPNHKGDPSVHAVQPDVFVRSYRVAAEGKAIVDLLGQIHRVPLAGLVAAATDLA